ncbi:MAG: hypothetical protein V4622_01800 [Bacteroidota bacterium]
MENFKVNLDRPKISSEEIAQKQNFENVLNKFNQVKTPVYKNPWFWGSAGLASVGLTTIVSLNAISANVNPKKEIDDKKATLTKSELPKDTECIKAPIEGENIDFKTYHVNALKDEKIVLESGTTIEIPKGSLLAENKTEKVDIKIREFHDKASVFIAGIPMDYENNTAFESAGMIEIRGVQNNKEVKINPKKPLEISLKTDKNPETFDFWYLNEESKSWEIFPTQKQDFTSNFDEKSNQKSVILTKSITNKKSEIKTINDRINLIDNQLSKIEKPKEEEFKIPKKNSQLFDLDFDKNDYPELATFKELVFEIIPSKTQDPNFTKKNWSDIDLSKDGDKYLMKFKNSRESYQTYVRPVLKGSELKIAEKKFDLAIEEFKATKKEFETKKVNLETEKKAHEVVLNKLINEETRKNQIRNNQAVEDTDVKVNKEIQQVAGFSNFITFQAPAFGVFNCDKPIPYPKAFESSLAFLWIGHQIAKFKQIFIFDLEKNTRYTYSAIPNQGYESIDNIGFHKNNDIVVVGIDFDGNVGYAEFKDRKNDKSKENHNIEKIVFTKKDKSASTLDLLKKLLNETGSSV